MANQNCGKGGGKGAEEGCTPSLWWFALKVPGGREFAVERILRGEGHEAIVPVVHRLLRHKGKRRRLLTAVPVFYGYVFAGFSAVPSGADWGELFRLDVLEGVIGAKGAPLPIPYAAMHALLMLNQLPARRLKVRGSRPKRPRIKGEHRICNGPFRDWLVRVDGIEGGQALWLWSLDTQPLVNAAAA